MIKFLPILCLVFLLYSCNNFFAVTINGRESKKELHHLFYASDSLDAVFHFSNPAGHPDFHFVLTNKLDIPIFVDWRNTVITFDNRIYNYDENISTVQLDKEAFTNLEVQSIKGTIQSNGRPNVIPPNSFLQTESKILFQENYTFDLKNEDITISAKDKKRLSADFNEMTSPKKMNLFLATKIGSLNGLDKFYHFTFWVQKVKFFKAADSASVIGNRTMYIAQ